MTWNGASHLLHADGIGCNEGVSAEHMHIKDMRHH